MYKLAIVSLYIAAMRCYTLGMNGPLDLLLFLADYHRTYRAMRNYMAGYTGPIRFQDIKKTLPGKDNTLRITLTRLKKQKLVDNNMGGWTITSRGKTFLKKYLRNENNARQKRELFIHGTYPRQTEQKRNMIVAFDIPEIMKAKRHWLRIELKALGFKQLQKSLWFGPSPLPKEFVEGLARLSLLPHIKFFRATEQEII